MQTLKPFIKDTELNKYVLETVKSRDPDWPLWVRVKGHMTYFLNFETPSITFEWKNLHTE